MSTCSKPRLVDKYTYVVKFDLYELTSPSLLTIFFSKFLLTTLKSTILFFILFLNCLVGICIHGFNFEGAN